MAAPYGSTNGVRCRNLVKVYGQGSVQVPALRGIDVDIAPGELTLLVGPSGCGKTTLISILAGTMDPTSGSVCVLGTELTRLSRREKTTFRAQRVSASYSSSSICWLH